jgi:hypothetical protein
MPYRPPVDAEDLEKSRASRIARRDLDRTEQYVHLLIRAARMRKDIGQPVSSELEALITKAKAECLSLHAKCQGVIAGRRRPQKGTSGETYKVYLDECGSHALKDQQGFLAFCLGAVIIRDAIGEAVDQEWKAWKQQYLGSRDFITHEPDIRAPKGVFKGSDRDRILAAMGGVLSSMDYTAVVCVVHRPNYVMDYGQAAPDESLPTHPYLMALDFLMERVVIIMDRHLAGAKAALIAESRGPLEDALLQHDSPVSRWKAPPTLLAAGSASSCFLEFAFWARTTIPLAFRLPTFLFGHVESRS